MSAGRIVSGLLATVTVAGCAVLVVGMARAGAEKSDQADRARAVVPVAEATTSIPAQLPRPSSASSGVSSSAASSVSSSAAGSSRAVAPHASAPTTSAAAAATSPRPTAAAATSTTPPAAPRPSATPARTTAARPAPRPAATTRPAAARTTPAPARTTPRPALKKGVSLPLGYSTGSATRVITVVAHSTRSTTATLQAWTKAPGGGWLRYGGPVTAHIGSDGMSRSPSESRSATPIGSYTLTQAFGHNSDPGTALPYFRTTPADWWISQAGSLYNTHQRCSSNCRFTQGSPNEHLYYETPYYNYAVVIDYNTRNTGHVRQGAGSAFFLHVTDGRSTAGCVAIPQSTLISIMRWLTPSAHPRILIGTA